MYSINNVTIYNFPFFSVIQKTETDNKKRYKSGKKFPLQSF